MGKRRVYIGRLSNRTRERDLEDAFSKFGKILSTDLKSGFGFVEFDDSRDAEDCIREMDGRDFDGSRIIVEFSRPEDRRRGRSPRRSLGPPRRSDYRIKVEGLPRDVSWQDLKDHFRRCGDAIFADVIRDRSGCRGFVEYKYAEDCKKAIREFDGTSYRGETLKVKEDDRSHSRSRSPPRRRRSSRSPSRSRSPPRRRRSSRSPSPSRGRSRSRSRSRSPPRSKSPSPRGRSPPPSKNSPPGSPKKKATDDAPSSPVNGESKSAEKTN